MLKTKYTISIAHGRSIKSLSLKECEHVSDKRILKFLDEAVSKGLQYLGRCQIAVNLSLLCKDLKIQGTMMVFRIGRWDN